MIEFLRRAAPAVQPQSSSTTAAPPTGIAPTPPAPPTGIVPSTSYFQDAFDRVRSAPSGVNLDGAPSLELPPFLNKLFPQPGPPLIHLSDGWTPQGQGYDKKTGELLTTYYNEDDQVLLSYQDKKSGEQTHQVTLGGKGDIPAPSHGGGVSTDGEFVYVADTDRVYVYTREDILEAEANGGAVEPVGVTEIPSDTTDPVTGIDLISNGSYMTIEDGYAYVGGYSEDGDGKVGAVWRYKIDPETGELDELSRQGPIRAPDRAQGIDVVDGALLFTTGDKKLMYQPFDEETFRADIDQRVDISNGRLDSWAQGFNIIDGELWVTYESGSQKYDGEKGRQHIQRIPLDQLDLEAAGITPEDLQRESA